MNNALDRKTEFFYNNIGREFRPNPIKGTTILNVENVILEYHVIICDGRSYDVDMSVLIIDKDFEYNGMRSDELVEMEWAMIKENYVYVLGG